MYIYHYHATKQVGGTIMHIDGIARLIRPVQTMRDYTKLKDLIAENQQLGNANGLVVCSLSLLKHERRPLHRQ